MGNYHPHGDTGDLRHLVRLAQPFSLRYPLVDGQGNFGSIDDDPPAAMRYTEARLARLATELLEELDSDTVDFGPNYDESEARADRPARRRFPNLLVNGIPPASRSAWRANIPPHNLGEVTNAIIAMIDDPDISVDKLMQHVKGLTSPPAATSSAGRGSATRIAPAAAAIGHARRARTSKSYAAASRRSSSASSRTRFCKGGDNGVIKKIADLVKSTRVLTEISDLADHSDRTRHAHPDRASSATPSPQVALNKLFKLHVAADDVRLQRRSALVDGVPRTLSLLELIRHYLDFQRGRSSRDGQKFELRKAEERAHVLQGYLIALDNLDEVIALIRAANDTDEARQQLMTRVSSCPEIQASAILELRLRALTAPRAQARRGRVQRPSGAHRGRCARSSRTRRAIDAVIREELLAAARDPCATGRAPLRDRRGAEEVLELRGSDRRGGHGDRDHALGLHQAARLLPRTANSAAAASASWEWT